jgi:hypothetical protein
MTDSRHWREFMFSLLAKIFSPTVWIVTTHGETMPMFAFAGRCLTLQGERTPDENCVLRTHWAGTV